MLFLYCLTWVSYLLLICGFTFALSVALYLLAELIEENTKTSAKIIRSMIVICTLLFLLLVPLENFPITLVAGGLCAQVCHFMLMQTFPAIQLKSIWFAGTLVFCVVNHILAFRHFTENYYPFNEVAAFFILFMWIVPMALLVSLSANDMVLPNYNETVPLVRSRDNLLPSQYASRRKGGYSLKNFLTHIKENYLPLIGIGAKKSF
ncbi:protein TEX261-like [Paramacrobiotus metropolitanus]|uniref:protein TEX261-like n=1 Tax=Paramacrobiotus metropolitanus TaxID=2943436 RepID=UPI002445FA0C|nr:protein TEX261-like [Paramacrobiotus metropolitanus]